MDKRQEQRAVCKITNHELYRKTVKNVDCSRLVKADNGEISGQVYLTTLDDKCKPCYGLFERDDFEEEFGFVLEVESYRSGRVSN